MLQSTSYPCCDGIPGNPSKNPVPDDSGISLN